MADTNLPNIIPRQIQGLNRFGSQLCSVYGNSHNPQILILSNFVYNIYTHVIILKYAEDEIEKTKHGKYFQIEVSM